MALNKDTLFNSILAATGGKVYVKYNVNGDPLYMVRISKFNIEDIDPALGSGVHPAFVVNGEIKNEIFIGAYQAIFEKGCALSIPGQSPKVSITFDQAKAACVANSTGFHLMTNWEWSAIALWRLKNGHQPRGNTNSSKSHEAGYETGTPAPDNGAKTLGGSGPMSWRHDNTHAGIADLVGNVWEWQDGLKIVDGQIYMPNGNNFTLAEASWPAQGVYFDASAGPGDRNGASFTGTPILSNGISKYSETPTPAGGTDSGDFDYAQAKRQLMAQALIAPKIESAGSVLAAAKGAIWVRNYGERMPIRGGDWYYGAGAGLAALYLRYWRSLSGYNVGCRPALPSSKLGYRTPTGFRGTPREKESYSFSV